jgi:hypothetical protein
LKPLLAAGLLALAGCVTAQAGDLARFEAVLAVQDSATAALGQWCAARGIATPAQIRAAPVSGPAPLPTAEIRARLGVGDAEPLGYRHVRLTCGAAVLSDAQNWYVPARLTEEMNRQLQGDTPFGTVVAPLGFRRARGPAVRGKAAGCPAGTILSHSAVLRLADGSAISAVTECYTATNLQ